MSTYLLGITSANAIDLHPMPSKYNQARKQKRSGTRTRDGSYFEYVWYTHGKWTISTEFLSGTDASIVNSWWESRAELLLFVTSSTATAVNSVMMMDTNEPFGKFNKPYDNLFKGTIKLETY